MSLNTVQRERFNGSIESFELLEPLPEKAQKILAVLGADGVAAKQSKSQIA